MKCIKRQLLKKMVLVGILIVGISTQTAIAQAAEVPVVTQGSSVISFGQVEHNRNYVWSTDYYGFTVTVKVNLNTVILKNAVEFDPCSIDNCKLICNCVELERIKNCVCENLLYADGNIEVTISGRCGVIYKCKKVIHHDVRNQWR